MGKISFPMLLILAIVACAPAPTAPATAPSSNQPPSGQQLCSGSLRVVAASEVKVLENANIFADFTKESCVPLTVAYKGSVDIKNQVTAYTANNLKDVDVFWAASPIGLPGSLVNSKSIVMKTYPVLTVDKQKAADLGWDTKKGIGSSDVIAAIKAGKLTLAMPSASQDDAGAIFYLAVLSSLKGGIVQSADLKLPTITDGVKTLFSGVGRSAASADALQQIVLADRLSGKPQYAAAMLPEVMAISLNRALAAKNVQPMTVFYMGDATDVETFPLGYVSNVGDLKIAQFNKLITYLKSPKVQEKLKALGWRTNPVGMSVENPDPAVFNTSWGIQPDADFPPITMPKEAVIDQALALYQGAFRKPSFTVYCLDYSSSMSGNGGEKQLKDAMDLLLDQTRATTVLLQATQQDRSIVYAFTSSVSLLGAVSGNDAKTLKSLSTAISQRSPNGNTAMFECFKTALDSIANGYDPKAYNYSIIALTDGDSNTGMDYHQFPSYYQSRKLPVPIYGIAFGNVNMDQLNVVKSLKAGDVPVTGSVCAGYKGGDELVRCFREAKGSN